MANQNGISVNNGSATERWDRRAQIAPPVDIYENRDELLVVTDVPGVKSDGVTVRLEKDELYVHARCAEREAGEALAGSDVVADFSRTFVVPRGIDPERITAELKDGVLTIRLPKSEAVKPRKIAVRAS